MLLTAKVAKAKQQFYTLHIPRQDGIRIIRIPTVMVKCMAGVLCLIVVMLISLIINYREAVNAASIDKIELARLQQVNSTQAKQIEQLSQATTKLQADINRLNLLDAEIRRFLNADEATGTSRSLNNRHSTLVLSNGQGGPNVNADLDSIAAAVSNIQAAITVREQSLTMLRNDLAERKERLERTPTLWPAAGGVTSRFGWRSSPWGGGGDWHPGIDIANDYGIPIVAAAAGEVVFAGWNNGGYGKMVQIDHGNGIETLYGHCAELVVRQGQYVKKGQLIAYMGSTGASTGPHVHYEVRVNGSAVNPVNFLK